MLESLTGSASHQTATNQAAWNRCTAKVHTVLYGALIATVLILAHRNEQSAHVRLTPNTTAGSQPNHNYPCGLGDMLA